jgi:phosphoesterase RecJ-like protein
MLCTAWVEMEAVLAEMKAPFIMIDHHQNRMIMQHTRIQTPLWVHLRNVIQFHLFLDKKEDIDKTIGTCIYTGILTDSGSFRFPGTTGNTHRIVAELMI